MLWTQDVNPQIWRSGALYVAAAWENWVGLEEGFIGYIYEASNFPKEPVKLSGRWGRTPHAALTRAVKEFDPEATLPETPATNARAYPFEYDLSGRRGYEWRVWRPDREPHHFGHYKTEAAAQRSADRINAKLGIEKEVIS